VDTRHHDFQTDRQTEKKTQAHSVQFYSTQTFVQEVFNISAFKTRLFTSLSSLSPVRPTIAC
jgi:hypothetical protein